MTGLRMNQRNVAAAVVLILLSVAYGYLTSDLPKRTLPNTPDPAFMPWINTALLAGLSLLLLAGGLRATHLEPAAAPDPVGNASSGAFLAAFVGYIVVLPVLGFVLSSIPFFAVTMMLFGERRKTWLVLGSTVATILLFALFRHVFNIVLPRGIMPAIFG